MTVYLEYWPRERFEMQPPVCDLCATPLIKFPCPVIIAPFDYILVCWTNARFDPRRSYVMKGGMAHCETCFPKVIQELKERGAEVILR